MQNSVSEEFDSRSLFSRSSDEGGKFKYKQVETWNLQSTHTYNRLVSEVGDIWSPEGELSKQKMFAYS